MRSYIFYASCALASAVSARPSSPTATFSGLQAQHQAPSNATLLGQIVASRSLANETASPSLEDDKPQFYDPPTAPFCEPAPDRKYRDAHELAVRAVASWTCDQYLKDFTAKNNFTINTVIKTSADGRRIYDKGNPEPEWWEHFLGSDPDSIWVQIGPANRTGSAMLDVAEYNMLEPVPRHTCEQVLFDSWKTCYGNKGRGGHIMAGYLSYSMRPW